MRDLNKFKGCLICGAVGDAQGYAVEFLSAETIFEKYGEDGITEYELCHGVAEISDDTQMTLFTETGLLVGTTRGMTRGIMGDYADYIALSYGDWYKTQTKKFPLATEPHYSWLVNIPEMFSRRAPGNTCLSALSQGGRGTLENPINNRKGCGGVMRVAPIGLYFANGNHGSMRQTEIDLIGVKAAALGFDAIPQKYLDKLELKDVILEIAEDLHRDCQISEYEHERDERWESKYIEMSYSKKKVNFERR